MTRNILTLLNPDTLSNSDVLLYHPYKNLVSNFYQLATQKDANQFDFITREFNGIDNADEEIKAYYESLLGVTSYFQASKGGRGKYIEKKLASSLETCCLDIKISDLPKFLLHRDLIRKHKLFGKEKLTSKEKEHLRLCQWDFIGSDDETTDLVNVFVDEGTISFLELKNRVDSGGTAARREIYDNKFKRILTYFIDDEAIFKCRENEYTLSQFYNHFKIKKIKLALGILFSSTGELADKESDKKLGFYSSSKDGFKTLNEFIEKNNFKIKNIDDLSITLETTSGFSIEIKNVYGEGISDFLFHKKINLPDLIKNKYHDIWLFQLLAIDERHHLLKYGENITLNLVKKIKASSELRKQLNDFISSGDLEIKNITSLVDLSSYKKLIPNNRDLENYVCDVLYFILANDDEI